VEKKQKNAKGACLGVLWVYSFLPGTNTATATAVVQSPFLSPMAFMLKAHVFWRNACKLRYGGDIKVCLFVASDEV
jgi:hypothetical protein